MPWGLFFPRREAASFSIFWAKAGRLFRDHFHAGGQSYLGDGVSPALGSQYQSWTGNPPRPPRIPPAPGRWRWGRRSPQCPPRWLNCPGPSIWSSRGVAAADQSVEQLADLQLVPCLQGEEALFQLVGPHGVLQGSIHAGDHTVAVAMLQLGKSFQTQPLVFVGSPCRVPEVKVPQGIGDGLHSQSRQVLLEALGFRLVSGNYQCLLAQLLTKAGNQAALVHPRKALSPPQGLPLGPPLFPGGRNRASAPGHCGSIS